MKWKILFSALVAFSVAAGLGAQSLYQFQMKDIDGKAVQLDSYKDQVLLIVNTASYCGYTYQYRDLEALYQVYKEQGFTVLAFPANNFLAQEPGSDASIKQFCTQTFKTSFPLFSKIDVAGPSADPLFKWLTSVNPKLKGPVTWNFNKFLINRKGELVARFDSTVEPFAPSLVSVLESSLAK